MPNPNEHQPSTPARPDTRDWSFVMTQACPECGFTPGQPLASYASRLRDAAARWDAVLARPGLTVRPEPDVWSPLEYACHVRDVIVVFDGRLGAMLSSDNPTFEGWDGERAAVDDDYNSQDPRSVSDAIAGATREAAGRFDQLRPEDWQRPGLRSDGQAFTVASLADYWLHEVQHHLHDVNG